MSILIFDTETTGLPSREGEKYGLHQPRLTEIAWIFYNDQQRQLGHGSVLINGGHIIGREVRDLNGIDDKLLVNAGVPPVAALYLFKAIYGMARIVASYGMGFDRRMLKNEVICLGGNPDWIDNPLTAQICIMKTARDALHASRWPKLAVAHQEILQEPFVQSHRAMEDVEAAARIFWHLKQHGHVII